MKNRREREREHELTTPLNRTTLQSYPEGRACLHGVAFRQPHASQGDASNHGTKARVLSLALGEEIPEVFKVRSYGVCRVSTLLLGIAIWGKCVGP